MKKIVSATVLSLVLITGNVFGQDKPLHEVYSMMVYNFVKYVQWPANSGSGDFVIGVVGNTEMYNTMAKWYNGNKIGTHTCVVKQFKSAADVSDAQVIFIDRSKSGEFDDINSKTKGKNTLIVTDKNGLGERGSSINFKVVDSKLKFELNQKALEASNLKVASSLAAMAILI